MLRHVRKCPYGEEHTWHLNFIFLHHCSVIVLTDLISAVYLASPVDSLSEIIVKLGFKVAVAAHGIQKL
jgi:hypothetical protein